MIKYCIVIQGSTVDWTGSSDSCTVEISGMPAFEYLVRSLLQVARKEQIILCAGDISANRVFDRLRQFGVHTYYGDPENILKRILSGVIACCPDADAVVRVGAGRPFVDLRLISEVLDELQRQKADVCRPPFAFEDRLSPEVATVEALLHLDTMLSNSFIAHSGSIARMPIAYMTTRPDIFKVCKLRNLPTYSDNELNSLRELNREYEKQENNAMCSSRYKLALKHLQPDMKILDVGCGNGVELSEILFKVEECYGLDRDFQVLKTAQVNNLNMYPSKFKLVCSSVCQSPFRAGTFDAVLGMDIVEHIQNDVSFFVELHRLIKPNGLVVISTPMNEYTGRIPMNPWHIREYTAGEFRSLLTKFFDIEKIYFIHGHLVVDDTDASGQIAICRPKSI